MNFKVGDRVIYKGSTKDFIGTVVEWAVNFRQYANTNNNVAIRFDYGWYYSENFPHNWRRKDELRLATKLDKVLL